MTSPSLRALANQIASLRRQVHAQATASQASLRSIEGGSIDVYDDDDNLIGVIGLQKDGTVGAVVKSGAKPEAPTDPDINPIPGGAIVAWDGQFEDAQSMTAIDRIAVHMSEEPGFLHDQDTEVAAIYSANGGTAVIPIDDGAEWYVKLVAVSKGGVESDPSTEIFVAAVDSTVAFHQDERTLSVDGAQEITTTFEPLPFSEHLYWHPGGGAGIYQREDVAWTREGHTVDLLDPAGILRVGDLVTVEYAYRPEDGQWVVVVPFGASGWKGLPISSSDATNRSGVGFSDSGWSTFTAAVSNSLAAYAYPAASSTAWAKQTAFWLRRQVEMPTCTAARITVRVDNYAQIYWNGDLVGSVAHEANTSLEDVIIDLPAGPAGTFTVAIRADDDAATSAMDRTYIDVQVEVLVDEP